LDIDLIILSAHISSQVALYDMFSAAGIQAAYFSVDTFEDYLDMLKICTDITGRQDLYKEHGTDIEGQIRAVVGRCQNQEPPTVLLLRSNASKTAARGSDTMTGRMLLDLGCVNITDKSPSLLDDLSMEIIIREDPDYILVVPQGESEAKALAALKNGIQSNPAWTGLSAVKNERCAVLPKALFHLKPNNRWGESYEVLADILYGGGTYDR
jgi:iron complex transport system substrate-binding protein